MYGNKLAKGDRQKYSRCLGRLNKHTDDITYGRRPSPIK